MTKRLEIRRAVKAAVTMGGERTPPRRRRLQQGASSSTRGRGDGEGDVSVRDVRDRDGPVRAIVPRNVRDRF